MHNQHFAREYSRAISPRVPAAGSELAGEELSRRVALASGNEALSYVTADESSRSADTSILRIDPSGRNGRLLAIGAIHDGGTMRPR